MIESNRESELALHIRRYQPEDSDAIWELYLVGLDAVGGNIGNGPWNEDMREIDRVYLKGSGEFLVGIVEGRVVASGAFKKTDDRRAELKRMRVRPEYWRRGFAKSILLRLERRARELGYCQLHLSTNTQQEAAQRLYEKNGYVETNRSVVELAGRTFDLIHYEKSL